MRGFLFFIALIFLFSCGDADTDRSRVFRYNESNGISSLDPAFARNLENMWACNQLFDGLVELDSTLQVVPSIAHSWDISDDGTVYTFRLRSDVYFHDDPCFEGGKGRLLTASDLVYSFERILSDELASPGRWVFNQVDTSKSPFLAPNDSTLVIRLKNPFPPFLGLLTTQYCNALPKEAIDHYGDDFRSNPVGTGPFKFAFWMEDVALVFHRNTSFWKQDEKGQQLPYLDAVKIDFIRDMGAEFQGLLKGDYDFMSGVHASYKDELLTMDGKLQSGFEQLKFQKTAFIKTDYLGILVDDSLELSANSPLHNKKVRQAISFAIDKKKMVKYLRNNTVIPAELGFIPKGMPPFSQDAGYGYSYDPDKARSLLKEAGFPGGKGLGIVEISTTGDYVDLIEFIQHNLSEVGIEVSVNVLQSGPHREMVAKSRLPVFRKSWFADYADAENFLSLFYSKNFCPNGPNYTHYYSSSFDSLFERSIQTVDVIEREKLYRKMDSLVMSDAPVVPLFYDQVSHFIRNEVTGFQTNPVNMIDLSTVRKSH